jgi:hypothetical protein
MKNKFDCNLGNSFNDSDQFDVSHLDEGVHKKKLKTNAA